MKRSFNKLSIFIVTILGIFLLASCNKGYKYPSVVPTLTNKDGVYLTLDNYKITNEQIYRRMLVNNGLETFNDWIDSILLADIEINQDKLNEMKNETIYGVKNLTDFTGNQEETLTKFENNMKFSGYYTKADIDAYFALQYRRHQFAKQELEKQIAKHDEENPDNPYFSEDVYKAYYTSNYKQSVTSILLTFNSDAEALDILDRYDVHTERLSPAGWQKDDGTLFTKKEIAKVFIEIYNDLHRVNNNNNDVLVAGRDYTVSGDDITFNLKNEGHHKFNFTYSELSKISSSIASRVFNNLDEKVLNKSYTYAPVTYSNNIFYLALKVSSTDAKPLTEVKSEIFQKLVEQGLTTDVVNRYLYDLRVNSGLEVFDEALETNFEQAHNTTHQNLDIKTYPTFNRTKDVSDKNIATFKLNDTTHTLTADQLFEKLSERYGVQTSVAYMNQHIILTNKDYNPIFNPETNEIYDQKKYDELYKNEVQVYKDELAKGTFASMGIPANYGWNNFLRDYLGVMSEAEILANTSIYDDALKKYAKSTYTFGTLGTQDENTVSYQMEKIYQDFFSASVFTISIYTDFDLNGIADKEENFTPQQLSLIDGFFNKVIEEADKVNKETFIEKVNTVLTKFKVSQIDDTTWGVYKLAGLRLAVSSKSDYTSASSLNETLKTTIKGLWNQIKEDKKIGQSLDTKEKRVMNQDKIYTSNGFTKVIILSTTDATYINKTTPVIYPTEEIVNKYWITQKSDAEKTNEELKVTLSTAEKNAINAYYLPAIKVLETTTRTDSLLVEIRKQMITNNKLTFTNPLDLTHYQELIEISQNK